MTSAAVAVAAPVPAVRVTGRVAAGALQRCGGRACPPGTCDHDGTRPLALARRPLATGRAQAPGGGLAVPSAIGDVVRAPGEPLPVTTRRAFEQGLGHDFRDIRIHTDDRAARSATAVGATAYTVGQHIVFGSAAWQPGTSAGRATLAHELVHTIQQGSPGNGAAVTAARTVEGVVPPDHPTEREAERFAGAWSESERIRSPPLESGARSPTATVAPGGATVGFVNRQTGGQGAGQTGTQATGQPGQQTGASAAAQQCTSLLATTTAEAVRQLQIAEDKLLTFESEQVYPLSPGDPAAREHQRVAAHLGGTFNTTDALSVQAIAFRLARLRRALSGGEIQMSCGTGCGAAVGGNVLAGRAPAPFQFTLCATNATPTALAPTLIHESAHAVLPEVGVTARPTMAIGSGVLDRAYDQERLFSHLTPTEALTNAESYSALVTGLVSSTGPPSPAGASDTVTGCSDRAAIETSLGRAQVAARLLANWLDGATAMLVSSGSTVVSTISDPFVTDLQAAFPSVQALADLRKLRNDASIVFNNFSNPESVRCTSSAARCPAGRLGFVNDVGLTASAQTKLPGIVDRSGFINVCPAWATAADDVRSTTMYALVATSYLGGAMIQLLTPADAMALARFAMLVVGRYLPAPRARSPIEHLSPTGP